MARQNRIIPTLDGWRGLAVIAVVLYHGRSGFFKYDSVPMRLSAHGNLGVNLFFALSGFLICGLLLKEYKSDGGINLRRFYIRRCFRILPPYYAVLAVLCILSIVGVIRVNYSNLPSCLLFYRNYTPLGIDFQGGWYTAHFWTLAVEEHFYLIWPMLLLVVKPKRAGKVTFLLAILVVAWRVLEGHFEWFASVLLPTNLLNRTDTTMDALLWGCLAAIYFPEIVRFTARIRFSQLWLPILATLLVVEKLHTPGYIALQAVLMPALMLSTVLQPASLLGRVLEWRPLRWLGTISYSLYLWQMLFLPELDSVKGHGVFRHLQESPLNLLAILTLACLSRYLIEVPMTRLGHRLSANLSSPALSHSVAMRAV